MNDEIDVERLVRWGKPKEVSTVHGPRILRKARPTEEFYAAWSNGRKDILKAMGISMGQDRETGTWQVLWWQKLPEAVLVRSEENLSLSRAATADIEVPVPEGLAYMPFQRAGIAWACRQFGVDLLNNNPLPKGCPSISGGAFIADEMGL